MGLNRDCIGRASPIFRGGEAAKRSSSAGDHGEAGSSLQDNVEAALQVVLEIVRFKSSMKRSKSPFYNARCTRSHKTRGLSSLI